MGKSIDNNIIIAQTKEHTEYLIYKKLSAITKNEHNKKVLRKISEDELRHYNYWKSISKEEVAQNRFLIWFYTLLSHILGLSFGLKLMEKGEKGAQKKYKDISSKYPKARQIMLDEQRHEKELLTLLEEEQLEYTSSIVLGLNDALVELTGALAGFTFALQNGKLIALIGLITGIAASMSMAASDYLSSKEENNAKKKPLKSAIYTGVTYIITVILLITPFFLLNNVFVALGITLAIALLIILSFTFYIGTAKDLNFRKKFLEMAFISMGIALISFFIGFLVKNVFGVNV
jgi:vacuolar iron transporter family protein